MASRLQDVILRGTAASRPLANTVAAGTLYYSTDTKVTEQSDGSTWSSYSDGGTFSSIKRQVTLVVDGAGSVITTGFKGFTSVPIGGTISKWRILSTDAGSPTSGSIVIDIWKAAYSGFPPTVANTITASAKPTVTTATKAESTTLTGWTTAITAGDVLGFNVDSVTSFKKVSMTLEFDQ
jgi:hypothetical protein